MSSRAPSGERITGPDPRITVLPDADRVFVDDQPWLHRVLYPLASVELSAFDPEWTGRIHFVTPVDAQYGYVGYRTTEHHDDHVGLNWIAFRVEDDGRYRFLGDPRCFEIENLGAVDDPEQVEEFYAEVGRNYERLKRLWRDERILEFGEPWDRPDPNSDSPRPRASVESLGGPLSFGNWSEYRPPAALELGHRLTLRDGRPLTYIGRCPIHGLRGWSGHDVILFFEPETRIAVLTFEST
ncbi:MULTISPECIES: hypothetical protein [unclassified Gordonia (in: high G+C Gram-positive bacteria)]|uniref:hypothetical protein n=1 Tax=unclassified Gordonia (in: high G+C Gram-positive bacteria) TaxID=2657482 RepID=UPI001FFF4D8F|nr:hypothetical protein [Gordonia sp. PP30]UQE76496.1 hypothetical protein MYK68_07995 [Gordonia sp. PP30]